MLTKLYFVRHCPYKNPQKILPGHLSGFPLSIQGKSCAKEIGTFFQNKNISFIYTSPILRCSQTATIIGESLHLKPKISQDLEEIKSPLQGISLKVFDAKGGRVFFYKRHFQEGGESLVQVFKRVKRAVDQLLQEHSGKNLVIVSHGDPIMLLIYGLVDHDVTKHLSQPRQYIPMGGVIKMEFRNDKTPRVTQVNY